MLTRRDVLKLAGVSLAGAAFGGLARSLPLPLTSNNGRQPAAGAPNILLILMDTVRARSMSQYGYDRKTSPVLGKLAERGVLFERAIAPAPWTLPSHAGIFTGRYPFELGLDWKTPLGSSFPTIAEALQSNGYQTAGFVANLIYCSYESGLQRGFERFEDYPVSLGQVLLSSTLGRKISDNSRLRGLLDYHELLNRKPADRVNSDFLSWLARAERRPFFAFLNYFDAHEPYLPPSPWDGLFGDPEARNMALIKNRGNSAERSDKWAMARSEIAAEQAAYDGAIAFIDYQIGVLFDELDNRGVLDNTVVIITSDHGEEFGEHRVFGHANSLYLFGLHVPLVIIPPNGLNAGVKVSEPVALQDLAATILSLAQVDLGGEFGGPGLGAVMEPGFAQAVDPERFVYSDVVGGQGVPDFYPTAHGSMKSLVRGDLHYILRGDGKEELFNYIQDPFEQQDLIGSPGAGPSTGEFRAALKNLMDEHHLSPS